MANTFSLPPGGGLPATVHSIKSPARAALLLCAFSLLLPAQISPSQRRVDFEQLAASVAKAYAPYQWKIDTFSYDALQLEPWLTRVAAAPDDLAYFELCMEYIASLRDLHSGFFLHSDFLAWAPVDADIYDGKAVIDNITRSLLPESLYPFQVGDELVSVDGQPAFDWIDSTSRLQSFANPRATRRWALDQILYRYQDVLPRAALVGDTARIAVRRASTGALESYDIPWNKSGAPLTAIGPVPTPKTAAAAASDAPPPGRASLATRRTPAFKRVRGFGALRPLFTLPPGFDLRYGRNFRDPIYSGAYKSGGFTIGYIRIPQFPSSSRSSLLRALDTEIAYLRANSDGLVLDVMRNPGGDVCLTNDVLLRFIPYPFRTVGDELRPTLDIVDVFRQDYEYALDDGADPVTLAYLKGFLGDVETAYHEYRGITGPLPICGFSLDLYPGAVPAYDKPMIVLIDEFSTSSADVFPAVIQDANRALMVGMPTAGGGGLSTQERIGFYSEASVALSISLGVRARDVFIENIGVHPDIELDIMTRSNLMTGGRDFVDAFTLAIVEHIRRSSAP
ncbi:MAG: hypothetical protein HY858_00680 [Candidatus Solibacter usitatus]|nr:hypothetical protein [Candidatus Solibacter usitatus]